uniref:TBC1 domain family member 15 n=1 Tax=Phallusia mammillata TaxID=59560 RepID=A0A6F9DUX2_9ASCI|nr:TBC1 domain family member 15 [Phallusia mammillata]
MEASVYLWDRQLVENAQGNQEDRIVAFKKDGVFVHFYNPGNDDDKIIGGTLSIVEEGHKRLLEWKPNEANLPADEIDNEHDTQVLSGSSSAVVGTEVQDCSTGQEISSEMRCPPSNEGKESSDPEWTVVNDSGHSKSNSVDHESFELAMDAVPSSQSSPETTVPNYAFSVQLQEIRYIKRSNKGLGWPYIVLEMRDGGTLPTLHFHHKGCKKFLKIVETYVPTAPSTKYPRTIEILQDNPNALAQSFDELNLFGADTSGQHHHPGAFAKKLIQDPVTTAFSGFSKVTNFLQDMLNPAETMPQSRPMHERASVMNEDATEAVGAGRIQIKQDDSSGGFELITCAQLGPRCDPLRGQPLDVETWNNHKDEEGRIIDPDGIKEIIFRGGIEPVLRKEVWKYLLGYFEWNMTQAEIKSYKKDKEDDYYRMKLQWKSISADQENRFSAIRDNKCLIEKDVTRTDRTRIFYEGNENISLKLLNDILMTYVMYNFDLGYVQGMSDLLSPILEVLAGEVDAFWCFVGFMNIVQHNFDVNQMGMKTQLKNLRVLIQFLDPKFWDHLVDKESSNLYFCFRWLLIRFKREFSFEDVQTLWEVSWTGLPCPNFHLLICLALLDTEKQKLMQPECGFTEILKHVNDLSGSIDLEATLRKAEGLYLQLVTCKRDLPETVKDILGLNK